MNIPTQEKGQPAQVQQDVSETKTDGRWPWWTRKPQPENPKFVVSKSFLLILGWHLWTIVPCLVTAVLLTLNFSGYVIGTYIGKDLNSTSDILAIIQVSAKVHEIIMLIGLVNIVQQAIQRSLVKDGLLLGLLGAELSLGSVFFIVSQEFRSALSFGASKWREQKKVFLLVALIFVVCLLSTVVGPASAVLMIPEPGWFLEKNLAWYDQQILADILPPQNLLCYPYIFIDPRLGGESSYFDAVASNELFYQPIPDYWGYSMFLRNHSDQGTFSIENRQVTHQFIDRGLSVTVNSSTSWNRTLDFDSDWKGETNFSTTVELDAYLALVSLIDYQPAPKNSGSQARFVADMTGISSSTVCRRRYKLSCNSSSIMTDNNSIWCFKSVTRDTDEGSHLQSQDLLLLTDAGIGEYQNTTRFWVTEGLRTTTNNKFTDTIVFVLEDISNSTSLVVCSTSATLDSVTATSNTKQFGAQEAQAHGDLYYFKPDSQSAPVPPRTILYHENWLDMVYHDIPDNSTDYPPILINKNYPRRNSSQITRNPGLFAWALGIQDAQSTAGGSIELRDTSGMEAGMVEIVLGGAFITMLARMNPSYMQYSTSLTWYPNSTQSDSSTSAMAHYPADLMPEGMIDCQYINKTLSVYHLVYGYNGKSISSILSTVVLLVYCSVAILGSLWQCTKGSIIQAWSSVPEYGTLCLGADPQRAIENTCAGIKSRETLKTLVGVRESEQQRNHLELVVAPPADQRKFRDDNEYGIRGMGRGRAAGGDPPS